MLPEITDIEAFRRLRRDTNAQRAAFVTIAQRHDLPTEELEPFSQGTHLVWGTSRAVIKVFIPLWPEDAQVEVAVLERLSGSTLAVPQLQATGDLAGYRYVIMSRLPGASIGEVWPTLSPDQRAALAAEMGEQMAALHALTPPALPAVDQGDLLAERRSHVLEDQRARGADERLLAQITDFVEALGELPPAPSMLLHADLTSDHFLVVGGRISGLIDFADAFVGPWTYELAAPACFTVRGDRDAQRALLSGMGRPDTSMGPVVRAWAVLHRYAHVATMMQRSGHTDLEDWLQTVWLER